MSASDGTGRHLVDDDEPMPAATFDDVVRTEIAILERKYPGTIWFIDDANVESSERTFDEEVQHRCAS